MRKQTCRLVTLAGLIALFPAGAALALAPMDETPAGGAGAVTVQPLPAKGQAPVVIQETPSRVQNRGPVPRNVIIVHPTPAPQAGAPAAQPAAPNGAAPAGAEPAPKVRSTD